MLRQHGGLRKATIAGIGATVIGIVSCQDPLAPPDRMPGALPAEVAPVVVSSAAAAGAPIAIDDAYATTEGVPLVISAPGLLANDIDLDGGTLFLNSVGQLSNGTFTRLYDRLQKPGEAARYRTLLAAADSSGRR